MPQALYRAQTYGSLKWRAGEAAGGNGRYEPPRQAYRGVTRLERERKWVARVWNGQKQMTLGRYETDVAAAQVPLAAPLFFNTPPSRTPALPFL
jgi:hypothetical protein